MEKGKNVFLYFFLFYTNSNNFITPSNYKKYNQRFTLYCQSRHNTNTCKNIFGVPYTVIVFFF